MNTLKNLLMLTTGLSMMALVLYGIGLAFKASIALGIIILVLEPSGFVLGIIALFHPTVCEELARLVGLK